MATGARSTTRDWQDVKMTTDTLQTPVWVRPLLLGLLLLAVLASFVVPAGQVMLHLVLLAFAVGISAANRWYWWAVPAFLAVLTLAVALSPLWV